MRVHNDIIRAMDGGKVGVLVMLDLSVASDAVRQEFVAGHCHGLYRTRVTVITVWSLRVSVRLGHSWVVVCLMQESVLNPVLFSLFTDFLGAIIRKHGLDFHFYADDSQLYLFVQPAQILVESAVAESSPASRSCRSGFVPTFLSATTTRLRCWRLARGLRQL